MRKLVALAQILLGLPFVVFGANHVYPFLPEPPEPTPAGGAFFTALVETGYFMELLGGTQIVCGLLLVLGRFVPLALTVLAPVLVHIVAYHLFLDRTGLEIALVLLALELFLVWVYWPSFRTVVRPHALPFER